MAHIRYLGIILDERLCWDKYLASLTARTRRLIYTFKSLRNIVDKKTLIGIYLALAQSIISYCISSWRGAAKTHMLQLERAQRALLRVALKKPFRYPTHELHKESQVMTVRQLYIHNLTVNINTTKYPTASTRGTRARGINQLAVPNTKTSFVQHFRAFLGPYLYNKASGEITNLENMNHFERKTAIRDWLIKKNYEDTESLFIITK